MKLLNGQDLAGFIQERHGRAVAGLATAPRLAVVGVNLSPASRSYVRLKEHYGAEIGVRVEVYEESADSLISQIKKLNADGDVTGIIIQLPLPSDDLTDEALATLTPAKDVDGLVAGSGFEAATPKAILWLLAGYNIDLAGQRIAVVGQGRLIGRPLADILEASGREVIRCDETTDLAASLPEADIIITATGQPGLIKTDWIKTGAVVIDCGAPKSELESAVFERADLTLTPNPGGVGPMTVAALFDNLIIAAQSQN